MDVELLEARWRMGRILTSDLPGIAAELAAAGHGGPSVSALAAGRAEPREGFERVLVELGAGSMSYGDAALVLARSFARQLLAGDAPPDLAAKAIGGLRWKGGEAVDEALLPFARLADRYEQAELLGPFGRALAPLLDRRARELARRLTAA